MADIVKKVEMRVEGDGTYNEVLYPKTSVDMVIGAETPAGAQAKANQAETNAKNASVPTSRTVNGLALSSNISLNHNHVGAVNSIASGSSADPNTTQEPYILTNHANSPGLGVYWHIHTYFYSSKTGNRAQQAISYNGAEPKMFIRHNYGGSWTPWTELGGGNMSYLVASNTLQESFDTERMSTGTNALVGKFLPKGTGEIEISVDLRSNGTAWLQAAPSMPKNGVDGNPNLINWKTPVGATGLTGHFNTDPIASSLGNTYTTVKTTIIITSLAPIYFLLRSNTTSVQSHCRNLRLYYDVIKN